METRSCGLCKQNFTIADEDFKFYEKVEVPSPTLCPMCRKLRRLMFRNDRKLYRRNCDLCKKSIIATYEAEAAAKAARRVIEGETPFPVYCPDCWWSDKWDSSSFAREYDFSRPFFEQWNELNKSVPHISLWQIQNQNTEFSHDSSYNKNCYMLFGADYNQDSYFSWSTIKCKDVCDGAALLQCERCYECLDCVGAQFCTYCQLVRNSSNCSFCFDLVNCHNCFGSCGLRNKSYYYFNEQLTPEQYEEKMKTVVWTPQAIAENQKKAFEASLALPRRYVQQKNCEECTGGYLGNCKNVNESFDIESSRDVKYSLLCYETKDVYDAEVLFYNVEVIYEAQTLIKNCFRVFFSYFLRDAKSIYYSNECYASHDLFGCVGLRNKQFAIFNKTYNQDEYENLKNRIIESMKARGEFGEFFPPAIAPFAYNESAAFDYLPRLPKEAMPLLGLRWKEENAKEYQPQTYAVPENISEVPDSITNEILACESCRKNYKIIPQELGFYRTMKLPIPRCCFDCRHVDRLTRRGPRLLFDRTCHKCSAAIRTIYAADRPEIAYCEKCYLATVY